VAAMKTRQAKKKIADLMLDRKFLKGIEKY
jgi:hypothetical protein